MSRNTDLNSLYSQYIIKEIIRNGASLFCLSPGHRSAPLAVALANAKANYRVFVDERSSAYFAVGHLKANPQKNLAVLICTSGTAVMNYYPAVAEAYYSHLPLLILSADRPPELRKTGANQTADQVKLFGEYVHDHVDLPCPSENPSVRYLLSTVDYFIWQARLKQGPVHINCMFREPLVEGRDVTKTPFEDQEASLSRWSKQEEPLCEYHIPIRLPDQKSIQKAVKIIDETQKGLVFLGSGYYEDETRKSLEKLLARLAWPVFSDSLSGGVNSERILPHLASLLPQLLDTADIETVLIIGERFISREVNQFIEKITQKSSFQNMLQVSEHTSKADPSHSVTMRICSDVRLFCKKTLSEIKKAGRDVFFQQVKELHITEEESREKLFQDAVSQPDISGCKIARFIEAQMNESWSLFLANSLSVRLIDDWTSLRSKKLPIAANRGLSGIDGNLASAMGFSEALKKPGLLLIGDLAFLHDLNSLNMVAKGSQPILIILFNNNGGGIFSELAIAEFQEYQKIFENVFVTPQNLTFQYATEQFGLSYFLVTKWQDLQDAYEKASGEMNAGKSSVIEVQTKYI